VSQVAGPVDGKSTGISTSRWIKVSESTSKVDPSVNPKKFKVLLSSSVKGQIQNIQASRIVTKKRTSGISDSSSLTLVEMMEHMIKSQFCGISGFIYFSKLYS